MTNSEYYDTDAVCGNCVHWRKLQGITSGTLGIMPLALQNGMPLGYCACGAVDAASVDAGEFTVPLLSELSDCLQHGDRFSPTDEFLDSMERTIDEDYPPKPCAIPSWEYRYEPYAMA